MTKILCNFNTHSLQGLEITKIEEIKVKICKCPIIILFSANSLLYEDYMLLVQLWISLKTTV